MTYSNWFSLEVIKPGELIVSTYSGPLRSRAAKAIGFIDMMIDYSLENAPLQKELTAGEFIWKSV